MVNLCSVIDISCWTGVLIPVDFPSFFLFFLAFQLEFQSCNDINVIERKVGKRKVLMEICLLSFCGFCFDFLEGGPSIAFASSTILSKSRMDFVVLCVSFFDVL